MKETLIALLSGLVAGILVLAGVLLIHPAAQPSFAGQPSPDVLVKQYFRANMEVGGGVLATSSQGLATYTAAQIMNNKLIEHNATAALTASLPTAASLSAAGFLKNPGDTYTLFVHASTTNITFAGNTGVNLQAASTTKQIPKGQTGRLEFTRLPGNEAKNIDVLLIAD